MDRHEKLQTRQPVLFKQVNRWAKRQKILRDGEEVRVTITIVRRKPVPREHVELFRLMPEDWEKILSQNWPKDLRKIIETIRKNKNLPVKSTDMWNDGVRSTQDRVLINRLLREYELPYRIKSVKGPTHAHTYWTDDLYAIGQVVKR